MQSDCDVDTGVKAGAHCKNTQQSHRRFAAKSKDGEERTLADYPRIVQWWHSTKNGNNLPEDYVHDSAKKVWLQCPGCRGCGEVHQWDAKAAKLTQHDGSFACHWCARIGGLSCSCRAVSTVARLAAERHEDDPSPAAVAPGSVETYKRRCAVEGCGHVWAAVAKSRAGIEDSSCPKCARKKKAVFRGRHHPSVAEGCQSIAIEWNTTRNDMRPTEVSCGSTRKVWWLCRGCGGSWQARVDNRALRNQGCPSCRAQRKGGK